MKNPKRSFLISPIRPAMVAGLLFFIPISLFSGNAFAQRKACECEFSSKECQAYGTGGACGIFMYNKGRTCEVSFAGTGANEKIFKMVIGEDAWNKKVKNDRSLLV